MPLLFCVPGFHYATTEKPCFGGIFGQQHPPSVDGVPFRSVSFRQHKIRGYVLRTTCFLLQRLSTHKRSSEDDGSPVEKKTLNERYLFPSLTIVTRLKRRIYGVDHTQSTLTEQSPVIWQCRGLPCIDKKCSCVQTKDVSSTTG